MLNIHFADLPWITSKTAVSVLSNLESILANLLTHEQMSNDEAKRVRVQASLSALSIVRYFFTKQQVCLSLSLSLSLSSLSTYSLFSLFLSFLR